MKKGEIVILDKGFNNSSKVMLIDTKPMFSTVKHPTKKKQWVVMTSRITAL